MGQAERASVVRLFAVGHLQNSYQNQPENVRKILQTFHLVNVA